MAKAAAVGIVGTVGTLESLRETLKQTLEEKQKSEQKYADEQQRLDQRIDEIKKAISDYIAELESMSNTIQMSHPAVCAEPLQRQQTDYHQPPPAPTSTPPYYTVEELRELLQQADKAAPQSSVSPVPAPPTAIEEFVWTCLYYIVGFLFLLLVVWVVMSMVTGKSKVTSHLPLPSLVETVQACDATDRLKERIQERRDARQSPLQEAAAVQEEVVSSSANTNKSKIHLAIVDLLMSLNTLDSAYAANVGSDDIFAQVKDQWQYFVEQYATANVRAEGTELGLASAEEKTKGPIETVSSAGTFPVSRGSVFMNKPVRVSRLTQRLFR